MAGTITHHRFSDELLCKLSQEIPINKDLFKLAGQGHDLGFFSKWYNLKSRSETHKFALKILQDKNFLDYIYNYINYMKINQLTNNVDVKNYLYGYIAHHYLDSFVHPYIIYKTGEVDKTNPETYKYAGKHCMYETQIDKTFMSYYNNAKIHTLFPKHIDYSDKLIDTNMFAISTTYNNQEYGSYFVEAMNDVYSFTKIFRYDPIKIKKILYKTIDSILKKNNSTSRYEFISINVDPIPFYDLNKNEEWHNPVNNEIHYESFMDLYNEALKLVIKVIEILEDIITNTNKDVFLIYDEKIPDRSSIHGLECNKELKLKYFKN